MTGDSLARLAKNDKLDIIYQDRVLPEVEPTMTRSRRRRQNEEDRAMQLAQLAADAEDSQELRDLNITAPLHTLRQVTFSDEIDSSSQHLKNAATPGSYSMCEQDSLLAAL